MNVFIHYKNRVLGKANGCNIHKIINYLGCIETGRYLYVSYINDFNYSLADEEKDDIEDIIKQLNKMTNVPNISFEELIHDF